MTQLFVRLYYCSLIYFVIEKAPFFLSSDLLKPAYVAFARPLNWLNIDHTILYPAIWAINIVVLLITIYKPVRWLRFLSLTFVYLFFSMSFSYEKITHSHHSWLLAAIFICLLDTRNNLSSPKNIFYVRLMQSLLLCPYFLSGLWKIRGPLLSQDLFLNAAEQMTSAIAEGNQIHPWFVENLLVTNQNLLELGFLFVVGFQLSVIVPILRQRNFLIYGGLAIIFHLTTGLIMGIWFLPTIAAILLLVIGPDFFLEEEGIFREAHSQCRYRMTQEKVL